VPRPRERPLFELGGNWISQIPGRSGFYRFWHDAGHGRTRRQKIGGQTLEEAKERLAELVVNGAPATADTYVTLVLEKYFSDRTDHLPSKKPARHAASLVLECWGEMIKVSMLTEQRNKHFVEWSLIRGHSISYVARNLGVVAAALEHAKLQVRLIYSEGAILSKWPHLKPKPKRKIFEPTDKQLAGLLRQKMPRNLRRWILNAMATVGRPTAVLELTPGSRDRIHRLINLNPEGRRQNKKFRAAVREPNIQTRWLNDWEGTGDKTMKVDERYCSYASESSIDTALERVCRPKKANLPHLCLYSFRHRGTSVLRAAKVPKEQIDYQLGHRQVGARSTHDYGQFQAGYLAEASAALDIWIAKVLREVGFSHGIRTKPMKRAARSG
jgi:hypothetical protein